MNQRELAYEILKKVLIDQQYANLVMRQYPSEELTPFITEVVYGVLRNKIYLTTSWKRFVNKMPAKSVEIVLDMITYELLFMNKKTHAVVYEGVNLVNEYQKKFVNGVIRAFLREDMIEVTDVDIKYSMPSWIYKLWLAQYKYDITNKLLVASNTRQKTYYQINPLRLEQDDLNEFEIDYVSDTSFSSSSNLLHSHLYDDGKIFIQDFGASQIVDALALDKPYVVLDMCSAPGTKAMQMAIKMKDEGKVLALDLHPFRVDLIKHAARRLKFKSIEAKVNDGLVINEEYLNQFDRILLDAPCSGLGVLARKPDIKYRLKPSDIDSIVELQANLLKVAIKYLKKNGILVYSTCTLNKKENEKQISKLLADNSNIKLIKEETIWPFTNDTDGFYVAKITKVD